MASSFDVNRRGIGKIRVDVVSSGRDVVFEKPFDIPPSGSDTYNGTNDCCVCSGVVAPLEVSVRKENFKVYSEYIWPEGGYRIALADRVC